MNFPKRTQEIATIICQRLDGDTELARKIVGHLKDQETDWNRHWHIHHLKLWHGSACARRPFPEYQVPTIQWRSDYSVDDVVGEVDIKRGILLKELTMQCCGWITAGERCGQLQDGLRFLAAQRRRRRLIISWRAPGLACQ